MADGVTRMRRAVFQQNKFENTAVKQLKTAVLDFYSIKVIMDAKQQLVDDVEVLKSAAQLSLKFPHIARRRAGEGLVSEGYRAGQQYNK